MNLPPADPLGELTPAEELFHTRHGRLPEPRPLSEHCRRWLVATEIYCVARHDLQQPHRTALTTPATLAAEHGDLTQFIDKHGTMDRTELHRAVRRASPS